MKKLFLSVMLLAMFSVLSNAQQGLKKVYDETIEPLEQIDKAVEKAKKEGKFVICQLGGNWCPWCLKFADYITNDAEISKIIADNYVYIHVNYNPRMAKSKDAEVAKKSQNLLKRLNNAGRFGYPALIVLDGAGKVIHIQDSGYLEEGESYNKKKVMSFLKNWTPKAVK